MSQRTPARRIVVAGAGPAGLMAALHSARDGHDVDLVERAPVVGGMSASFDVAGQRVDFGSHRLHQAVAPELLAELHTLLGSDLQVRTRNGRIRLEDKWLRFPLQATDLIRGVSPSFALGALADAVRAPWRQPESETFAGHVRTGLGPTVFDAFYGPYARKLWGVSPEEIDASMAQRRVSAGSPFEIAKRLLRARRSSGRAFLYPRLGYGQIAECLAEAASDTGVRLRCGVGVEALAVDDDRVQVTLANGESIDADVVLSTIPLQQLARQTRPPAESSAIAAADALEHRAMVFVYLVCEQEQYTPFDAHYFPELDTPVARLSEPKNYRDGPDPRGTTVLCAELACSVGDATWESSDDELGAMVAESLMRQGLPTPRHVATETRRLPRVYPVYRMGFHDALDELEAWASRSDRLLTFGRQGLFVPDNIHHTLQMGRDAAAAVTELGTIDRAQWSRSRGAFRSHVVED